jgi:hypothetical protein
VTASPETADRESSAKAMSLADWKRWSAFFSTQCRAMRSRPAGTPPGALTSPDGSSLRIAVIVSATVSR